MLARFARFCRAARVETLEDAFKDWDRLGRRKVTEKQFRQVLTMTGFLIGEEEFAVVCKAFGEGKDVLYGKFLEALEQAGNGESNKETRVAGETITKEATGHKEAFNNETKETTASVLAAVRQFVTLRRIRIEEYLKDPDPLRKGLIPSSKFRGVLDKLGLHFNNQQFEALEAPYKVAELIDYAAFAADVLRPGIEEVRQPGAELASPPADALLGRLARHAKRRGLSFLPAFQDKDKANCGKVGFARFRAILDVQGMALDDGEFELLCRRFGHQGTELNYVEFYKTLRRFESEVA